jgi:beta-lactamase class A
MNRPTRRRRRQRRRGLAPLLIPAIVGALSIFVATHYATEWGKVRSLPAAAVVGPEVIARAEEAAPPVIISTATLPPRPAQVIPTPTAPVRPTTTAAPRIAARSVDSAAATPLIGQILTAAPFSSDLALAAQISARIAGRSGRYGIAVKNLRTGQGVLLDPNGEYEAASLFKLPVMYEVFKQREEGLLSFDEQLVLTERHVAYDLGTLDRPAGSNIRLGEALDRMITISDNSSAILLTDRVGALAVNQDMATLGLSRTRVLLDDLTTSPGDMLRLLEMIALGQAVGSRASGDMVQILAQQRVNDRIPRLLPIGTVVAHKTGNVPGVVNDVGIVYGPAGPFVVAVLMDGTDDEGEAARATADIALMAYRRFAS